MQFNPDSPLQPEAWAMAVVMIRGSFPNKFNLTEIELTVWYETLKRYTNKQVMSAIPQMALTCDFPSLRAIADAIAETENSNYLAAFAEANIKAARLVSPLMKRDAQNRVIIAEDGFPVMEGPDEIEYSDPLVPKLIEQFGGAKKFLDRNGSSETTFFAQFRDAYKVASNRAKAEAAQPFNVGKLIGVFQQEQKKQIEQKRGLLK